MVTDNKLARRRFLANIAAIMAAVPGTGIVPMISAQTRKDSKTRHRSPSRIGIALGAGGAKGLAHVLMLEALDELGIRPALIAGSSMGTIIGALYASGLSGKDIREFIDQLMFRDGAARHFRSGGTQW